MTHNSKLICMNICDETKVLFPCSVDLLIMANLFYHVSRKHPSMNDVTQIHVLIFLTPPTASF
jgi:hypothetical protein